MCRLAFVYVHYPHDEYLNKILNTFLLFDNVNRRRISSEDHYESIFIHLHIVKWTKHFLSLSKNRIHLSHEQDERIPPLCDDAAWRCNVNIPCWLQRTKPNILFLTKQHFEASLNAVTYSFCAGEIEDWLLYLFLRRNKKKRR
jgi:hypothetical protein